MSSPTQDFAVRLVRALASRSAAVASTPPPKVNPSAPQSSKVVLFTAYERAGVTVMAVAGVLSCTLVSTLLFYIIVSAISTWSSSRHKRYHTERERLSVFTTKQIAVFITCLLVSDLIQSISGVTQVKWAAENRIYQSPECTLQATTLLMGDLSSTVWSVVIALHTFSSIALGKQWPRWAVWATVISGWTFSILLTFIAPPFLTKPERGPFFSIAGTWCFISSEYAVPRLVIHYVPLFIAAALILTIYGLIFFVLRGTISFERFGGTPRSVHGEAALVGDVLTRQRIVIAKRMLWYPVAYLTCILPIAIMRLVGLQEETLPDAVWIFGMTFLFLLGAVDSIIYATTRKVIKPIRRVPFNMVTLDANMRIEYSDPEDQQSLPSPVSRKTLEIGSTKPGGRESEWWAAEELAYAGEVEVVRGARGDAHEGGVKRVDGVAAGVGRGGGICVTLERIEEVI